MLRTMPISPIMVRSEGVPRARESVPQLDSARAPFKMSETRISLTDTPIGEPPPSKSVQFRECPDLTPSHNCL